MSGYIRWDVKELLAIYYDIWLAPGIDFDYIEARPKEVIR